MNTRAGRCCRSLFSRTVGPQNAEERACRELGVPARVQPTMRLEAVLGTLSLCPMGCGGGCKVVHNNLYQIETFQRVFSWNLEISLEALQSFNFTGICMH